jgi:hypothetical protein
MPGKSPRVCIFRPAPRSWGQAPPQAGPSRFIPVYLYSAETVASAVVACEQQLAQLLSARGTPSSFFNAQLGATSTLAQVELQRRTLAEELLPRLAALEAQVAHAASLAWHAHDARELGLA